MTVVLTVENVKMLGKMTALNKSIKQRYVKQKANVMQQL